MAEAGIIVEYHHDKKSRYKKKPKKEKISFYQLIDTSDPRRMSLKRILKPRGF